MVGRDGRIGSEGGGMWYDAQRTGVEAVKAVFSIAVLWGGMFVSGAADRSADPSYGTTAADDIVGVWEWVLETSARRPGAGPAVASLLEIRRDDAGRLSARVLLDDEGQPTVRRVRGVTFDGGRLCLEIDGRAAFKGTLRDDGRTIDGAVLLEGRKPSLAELWKVEAKARSPRGELTRLRAT